MRTSFTPTSTHFFQILASIILLINTLINPISARSYFRGSKLIDGMWYTKNVLVSIRSFGIAPFNFVVPSDHHAIFCDIDFHQLLDNYSQAIQSAPYRRLISNAPKRVGAYKLSVEKQWFLYNITLKINQLEDLFSSMGCTDENEVLLNKIDDQINEILTAGEKRCCKGGRQDNNQYYHTIG